VPASVLLTGLAESLASQRSPLSSSTRKSGTGFESTTGFVFTDVAARAGLGQASNVFGGVTRKRYLLELEASALDGNGRDDLLGAGHAP